MSVEQAIKFNEEFPIAAREIEEILQEKDDCLKLIKLKELFYHTIHWARLQTREETKNKIFTQYFGRNK